MLSIWQKIMLRFGLVCRQAGAKIKGNVKIGKAVYVARGAELIARGKESIVIGDNTVILNGALIHPYGGRIRIGSGVGINPYVVIYGHGGMEIGNNVMIATQCVLIPANHNIDRLDIPMCDQGLDCKGIKIEDDVWLGARVTVLDGVTIGKGSVIGAGSVVNRSIPPFSVAVGVPARIIKSRLDRSGNKHENSANEK